MKRFLLNVIAFVSILLLLSIILEFALFLRPNLYSYKRNYLENHLNDIHTLLLGNSHIEEALMPIMMSKGTFNMAISGKELVYDVEIAKKYIPLMGNLRNVVIQLDYMGFHFNRGKTNEKEERNNADLLSGTYKCMYYKYMGLRVDNIVYCSEILHSKLDYMSRFFKIDEDARECDSLGYVTRKLKDRHIGWENNNLPQIIDVNKCIDWNCYNNLYDNYALLSELTIKKNANLVLLGTPMYITYRSYMVPEVINEIKEFVERLQNTYPNVYYLDYTYDEHFNEEDFIDSSHLSEKGAKKFSILLNNDLKKLDVLK